MSLLRKLCGLARKATLTPARPATVKRPSFRPDLEKLESREVPTLMWPTTYTLWGATSFVSTSGYIR
jgi:hypothetical protein